MESREVLMYLHVKYKGNWNAINKALRDREEIDESVAKSMIDGYKATRSESAMVTSIESSYPAKAAKWHHPPFVIEWTGDLRALDAPDLVWIDNAELEPFLWGSLINTIHITPEGYVITQPYKKEDGTLQTMASVFYEDEESALIHVKQLVNKVLFMDADPEFVLAAKNIPYKFAVPGNSGCATNALIKSMEWHLCDSCADLTDLSTFTLKPKTKEE